MAEVLAGIEAGDDWLAQLLVHYLGLEGAIHACRVYSWGGVHKSVIALKQTDEGDTNRA